NLFYRSGRAPVLPVPDLGHPDSRAAFIESVRPLIHSLTPERIVADGAAYLDHLGAIARAPVAIAGYCLGARVGSRIAAARPRRGAAVAGSHAGGLVPDASDSPHLSAGRLRAEVYLGHADNDAGMTPDDVAALDRALEQAGLRHRTEVYAGAAHGYT